MLVTNQWVNSYKRLVPGTEAPMYVTWSPRNHSDLVRVPEHKPGSEESTRIEYRVPDAAANPYLAFAAVLAAGLDGIEQNLPAPRPRPLRHRPALARGSRTPWPRNVLPRIARRGD